MPGHARFVGPKSENPEALGMDHQVGILRLDLVPPAHLEIQLIASHPCDDFSKEIYSYDALYHDLSFLFLCFAMPIRTLRMLIRIDLYVDKKQ
jgi:hypothetical protein